MERPFNHHHVLWNRVWYKTSLERALRSHDGLVVPILVPVHKELHANIDAPPKPDRDLIIGSLEMLDDLPQSVVTNPLETVNTYAEWLLARQAKLAGRIGANLMRQIPYLEEGYYHV